MKPITLKGKASTGQGGGTKFVTLPWVEKQIIEKLGFMPYPGTLNLTLDEESIKAKNQFLTAEKAITIAPVKGYCCGLCFKARIMDQVDGAVVLPHVLDYPKDLLEVLAPVSLRQTLELREHDEVQLAVYLP